MEIKSLYLNLTSFFLPVVFVFITSKYNKLTFQNRFDDQLQSLLNLNYSRLLFYLSLTIEGTKKGRQQGIPIDFFCVFTLSKRLAFLSLFFLLLWKDNSWKRTHTKKSRVRRDVGNLGLSMKTLDAVNWINRQAKRLY